MMNASARQFCLLNRTHALVWRCRVTVPDGDRPFDMGTEHPVDEIRALCGPGHDALCLPEAEELILGRNAQRLLGIGAA
jgi:hypothetical protein